MNAYGTADEEGVLAAVRQEVIRLREVFAVIEDALVAAVERLEGLENHLGAEQSAAAAAGDAAAGGALALAGAAGDGRVHIRRGRGPRPLPSWKQKPAGGPEPAAAGAPARPGPPEATARGGAVTADTLRARREALGISQSAVAHAAHCSRGLVAEVERGKRTSAPTLAHLSATLDKLEAVERRT
jgi:DNA-binding XRE family transcriptional regulator